MVKKFNDAIRKLSPDLGTDVVERGGRPVLRIPNVQLFGPGDAVLKPDGKALLTQLAQAVGGQLDTFELRVVCYTDADAEAVGKKPADAGAAIKAPTMTSWDLTAERAATLSRFYRDQTALPFLNVLIIGRGNAEQVVAGSRDDQARNRRVEITVTPLPVPFHPPDPAAGSTAANDAASAATDTPAKKDKPKKSTGTAAPH
jgi:outer membrane protein OmpA-like peptidoglycan-associated protein